jgi:hypothetical protein
LHKNEETIVKIEKLGTISNRPQLTDKNYFLDDKLGLGGPPDKAVIS